MYDLGEDTFSMCHGAYVGPTWGLHGARLKACAEDWVLHVPIDLAELHHGAFLPNFCRINVFL